MKRKYFLIAVTALILTVAIYFDAQASSQGCGISEFTMDPTDPYILGDHVFLSGKSNCGTVRFEINGEPKSETGQPNQTMMWNTEEMVAGNFDVCFVARGDGGWENAARSCRHVYVEGGQAPPSGSDNTGGPVKCWVNVFNVSHGSVRQGDKFHLTGQGQCDGNARASRFSVDGDSFSEFGGYQTSADLGTKDLSIGSHQLCFHITGGSWDDEATSCVWVEVSEEGTGNNDVVEGDQAENDIQGQTGESGPDGDTQPQSSSDDGNSCAGVALSFSAGDPGQVNPGTTSNNLRRNPHLTSSWLGKIPGGDQFMIIGGPTCADGYWWWEVDYQGQNGWTVQGDGSDLWIGELSQTDSQDSDEPETEAPPSESDSFTVIVPNPIGENMVRVCTTISPNFWESLIQQVPYICTLTNPDEITSSLRACWGQNIDSVMRGEDEFTISSWLHHFSGNPIETIRGCIATSIIGRGWSFPFR